MTHSLCLYVFTAKSESLSVKQLLFVLPKCTLTQKKKLVGITVALIKQVYSFYYYYILHNLIYRWFDNAVINRVIKMAEPLI